MSTTWVAVAREPNSPYSHRWELKDSEFFQHPHLPGSQYKRVYGHLYRGGKHAPGWFIFEYALSEPTARLNPNLTLDEAQRVARILLTARKD